MLSGRALCRYRWPSYDHRRIILEENDVARDLPGKYVDSYEFADGRLEFHGRACRFPTPLSTRTRGSPTRRSANKRLGAVLEHIKAERDKAPPKKAGRATEDGLHADRSQERWLEHSRRPTGEGSPRGGDPMASLRPARLRSLGLAMMAFLLCRPGDISGWLQHRLYAQS